MNDWRRLGEWAFRFCRDPQQIGQEIETSSADRDARIREAARKLRADASRDVEMLRSRGWTQADFARALHEMLGSGEGDSA